jgi:hypothetical protein
MSDISDFSNLPGFRFDPFRTDTLISLEDPFIGTLQQTSRMKAFCKIMINSVDVTDKMNPHLISLRVMQGTNNNVMEIELDDRDATLALPPLVSGVTVAIGWESEDLVTIFDGWIDDIEHGFGRKQGGRHLWIHANSSPIFRTSLKAPIQDHLGEGAPPGKQEGKLESMSDWINQLAKHANISATIHSSFANIKSDYWNIANASIKHELASMAEKYGFVHQFDGSKGLQVEKPGQRGLSCHATWRDNLIGWRVRPFVAVEANKGQKAEWFVPQSAHWKFAQQTFGLKGLFAFFNDGPMRSEGTPAATETGANEQNQAGQAKAEFSGSGRIIINGEPRAKWNSYVLLSGARPGVDGLYWIDTVEHIYSRTGFVTTLDVMAWAAAPDSQNVSRGWLPKSALGTSATGTPGTADAGPSTQGPGTGAGVVPAAPGTVTTDEPSEATVTVEGDELQILPKGTVIEDTPR